MNFQRLHGLTDAIFAIVMTLLVLELKVPVLEVQNNNNLWHALTEEKAVFASYLISFALLFIYWRAHGFIVGTLAKNLNMTLININMLFLILIGILPFTTHLLGSYPTLQVAIAIYASNIILIGLTLFGMRQYIDRSSNIESEQRNRTQRINALIRVLTPVICSAIAILLSFINPTSAFVILLLGVFFNLPSNSADAFRKVFRIGESG